MKRALLLGVNLNSQDTLLKYIGGLHSYLKHTILMFNPNNLDEVCVQATHLESRGRNIQEEGRKRVGRGSHSRARRKRMVENGRERKMQV